MRKFLVNEAQLRRHNLLVFHENYPGLYTSNEGFTPIQEVITGENMTDSDINFFKWIYDRLVNVHGENENYDYMLKMKELIQKSRS